MAKQDDNLNEVQEFARALHEERESLGQPVGELRESLTELHRGPRATIELTEDEITDLLTVACSVVSSEHLRSAVDKLNQALAIESGPGGRFCDPA